MYVIKSNRKTNSYTIRKINRVTQVVRVGRRGLQGETGPQGPQGPKGDKGEPGDGLVESVAGKTGAVILDKADVGLGNVDNTSDLDKPISTATQTALDGKVNKVTTVNTLYGVNGTGNQTSYLLSQASATSSIAQRSSGGTLNVGTPTASAHATTKAYVDAALTASLSTKQDTLVSGTNIKTVNGSTLLGSGDIVIAGGSGGGAVDSVNGQTGVVVLNATDVNADPTGSASQALQNAKDYTDTEVSTLDSSLATVAKTGSYNDLSNKPTIPSTAGLATEQYVDNGLATKVDKEVGKGLSTNDYTTLEKNKLAGIANNATANQTDSYLLNRTNHTGTQAQSTITNLTADLAAKAPLNSPTFTGTVSGITKSMVGLNNADNTSDADKPVSTAQQTALNAKADTASLATVAISGSYNDLADKPTIPTISSAMGVAQHGTDANFARPNFAQVYWTGTVEPTNAIDGDIWRGA